MKHNPSRVALFALLWLGLLSPALAWNRAGHMVTGLLAYKELKASHPRAIAPIIALLRQHPDYPTWQAQLQSEGIAPDQAEMYLFAVALTWLFHLLGDVHQPLHMTALLSSQYPKGDRGGNAIYIRVKADAATINLHSYWDGLLLGRRREAMRRSEAT